MSGILRRRAMMPAGAQGLYRFVEWIKATGTQWLATDPMVIPVTAMVEVKTDYTNNSTQKRVFGCGSVSGRTNFSLWLMTGGGYLSSNGRERQFSTTVSGIHVFKVQRSASSASLEKDGVPISTTGQAWQTAVENNEAFGIFATAGGANPITAPIYYLKLTDTTHNIKLLSLLPAVRLADEKPGMLDVVSGDFLTNRGTGQDFIVGPDV